VVSKVTVNPPPGGGRPVTAYIEEKVSVRGAPLFAYAIFYSGNDLEFGETPTMDIYGTGACKRPNLFVGPAGSSPQALTFHGQVTASGNCLPRLARHDDHGPGRRQRHVGLRPR